MKQNHKLNNTLENRELYEKIVISFSIKNSDTFLQIKKQGITLNHFKDSFYRELWKTMEDCYIENELTELILIDKMKHSNEKEKAEKLWKIEQLKNFETESQNLDYAVQKLREIFVFRKLFEVANIITKSTETEISASEVLMDITNRIFDIENINTDINEFDSVESIELVAEEIVKRKNGDIEDGVPSGIRTLDKEIKCFYYSYYSIIIGRPGHGKTTLMLNTFVNNIKMGYKPVFFSLEMPAVHILIKMLAIWTKIPVNKILRPKYLTEDEILLIKKALNEMSQHEFYIVDAVGMNVVEFGVLLRKYIKKGCKIGYLDYIQLLKLPNGEMPNEAIDFRKISKMVREIIRKVNRFGEMALVVGAQAGREVERRPIEDRIPSLKDLEWSSSLEQDASVVIGLMNREKYEGDECEYKNQLFLGFPKHRFENAVKVNLAFLQDIQYITDLSQPERIENQNQN